MKTKVNWIANILATDRSQPPDAMVSDEAALKERSVMQNVTWQLMVILVGLAVSWPASADDQFPPCWRNQADSTFQEWRFDTSGNPTMPESATNPNGTPQATATVGPFGTGWGAQFPPVPYPGPTPPRTGLWDLGQSGTMTLTIPNQAAAGYKYIAVQVAQVLTPPQPVTVSVPGATFLHGQQVSVASYSPASQIVVTQSVWRLPSCPASETITLTADATSGSVIDQVVVDTLCVNFPCPSNITVNSTPGQNNASVAWTMPAVSCLVASVACTTNGFPVSNPNVFPVGQTPVNCIITDLEGQSVPPCSFNVTVNNAQATGPVSLQQLIDSHGFLIADDKKFAEFGFRGDTNKIDPANIFVETIGSPGCVLGLRFSGTMVAAGMELDFVLLYSVETTTGFSVISSISQSFMLSASGNGGFVVIGETVFDQGFFMGHAVAQSSVGFADIIDPPGEPVQGDRLVINPPLNKVWVTKDIHLVPHDAQSSVGLTKVDQLFCQGQDASPPVFTKCPSDVDLGCNPTSIPGCDLSPANVEATDNCGMPTITCASFAGPVIGCVHYRTNVYTATDVCGNSATCRQVLRWTVDTIPPVITCPANISVQCITNVPPCPASLAAFLALGGTASDNCDSNLIYTCSDGPLIGGICGGTIFRTHCVTDDCTNTACCIQIITVNDTIPPVITCPNDITVQCLNDVPACPPSLAAFLALGGSASDNCDTNLTYSCSDGPLIGGLCGGSIARTHTVIDDCTNAASCVQIITVRDTIPPSITCPTNITVQCLSDVPPCPTTLAQFLAQSGTASDNCDTNLEYHCSDGPLIGGACGGTIIRTHTVIDDCTNTASCVQIITVNDTIPPVITCPPNMQLPCGASTATNNTGVATATDNCGPVTVTFSDSTMADNAGNLITTRTWTATDTCGNTNACIQKLTVGPCARPEPVTLVCPASSGQVGVPYASALVASGGVLPYTFSITAGSLPPGLMLNPATGDITGIPTAAGNFAFTAQVVDSTGTAAGTATANCSITIIGVGGCRVTGGSNHQTNSYQSPCITTALPTHISHGGQVGAPFSVGTPFTPNSPCISGEWQHNRHLSGNSLVGNFHASGNGNEHQFDSLLCACLPCDENPTTVGVVGGTCNPDDRICGPEPRRAPANKICFSGVGDYTFTTGNKTVKAVFRVDIEDRSEGNSQSSSPPPDRYRIRLWLLDPTCGRDPDPNSPQALSLRYAASADPVKIATLVTTEDLKVNIPPDIDDGGNMTQGNHQIHPETGAQCGAIVSAPASRIDVATEIACLTPGGGCAFGRVAQGYQGIQDPAFVYRITITNSGTVALTNLSVIEMTDATLADTTALYLAPGTTLPSGGCVTRYCTNAWGVDTINTVTVSGNSGQDGSPAFAASTAMASVGVAGITCDVTLYSPCDLDGNANDNHLQLPPGVNCLVRLSVQVCNTGQGDLTGVTINDNWLNCSWPTFDLPHGACTNISCTASQSCPGVPIGLQVTVTGKVKADCSHGAYSAGGANIIVSSTSGGVVGGCPASVCGFVLRDYDANGNLTGEQGLAGRTVTLKGAAGSTVGTTTTDASGAYCFNNVAPGTYSVVVTPPANYQQTVDPDGTKDNKTSVTLTAGQNKTSVNFGYTGSAPGVLLVKTGPVTAKCGDRITYRFAVTNTGNACFFGGISVVDPMFGGEIWRRMPVAPGEGYVFTTNYIVKVTDQNWLTNTATATGHPPIGNDVTNKSRWIVQVSNGLLSPWQSRDIGSVGLAGGVLNSNGTFTVVGSGSDIGGTADAFRFVYQQGNGDCSIVAKVLSMQNTDPQAKAGVMIRETLNGDSKYVAAFVTPGTGVAFQSRGITGGITSKRNVSGLTAPYWVKVVRTGSTFTAYYSANGGGNSWKSMGSVTVTMGSSVYIGLGVTSHNNTKLCTATFSNVTATP